MLMNILNTSLFASPLPRKMGVGFHNISGVLRASNKSVVKKLEAHYGERCGHVPLDAEYARVLVDTCTADIQTQMEYLSTLFGKEIKAITAGELKKESNKALVVPYVNVPEAEAAIQAELGAESWGLPSQMVDMLKNKVEFYRLVDEFNLAGFAAPDYRISTIGAVKQEAWDFLSKMEEVIRKAGVATYPLGVMLRAAESDGNYGCCLVYERDGLVTVVEDGDAEHALRYTSWDEALAMSQKHLATTMDQERESRVVISRFLDLVDSPGMSVVILRGQVASLGWNGQLQKKGSKACVGTSSYQPKNAHLQRLQQEYEGLTAEFFEVLLRHTAQRCGVDFASINGVANIDSMLPGTLEERLQRARGQKSVIYLAECNPRWTNYTDAIMTVIGVNRKEQTISNMRQVIAEGIVTVDKYQLPEKVAPAVMRELLLKCDDVLRRDGMRVICRMAKNPMGLIFSGNVEKAQQEVAALVQQLR